MSRPILSSKEVALISIFASISSLSTLTTAFIPAPLPGLYAVISIPVGTILILTLRTLIDRDGIATTTQFISGLISTFLPGGPPVKWMIVPTWVIGGIVVDVLFRLLSRLRGSRLFYSIIGLVYIVPGDFLLYWSFSFFLGWAWPLLYFLYGFVAIHMALGCLAGLIVPDVLKRIKPGVTHRY
ncbi:MAG: hypothetical protein DRN15_09775 [Thermoprotei archaeon]|nr:MAG: hypothetical protein DRN15_09775 [Thermoprotei archaeon]RLF24629.1 MAG: hypothetical protein DRM97_03260 [Thermoprotei archaeon]